MLRVKLFYLSCYGLLIDKRSNLKAPKIRSPKEISVVIPVKNNQKGIEAFLDSLFCLADHILPSEVLIICDGGSQITLPSNYYNQAIKIRVLSSKGKGPAAARNYGWQQAKGTWILFTDSDCRAMPDWINGFLKVNNGSIGYAGNIRSFGKDKISRYYESQCTLLPPADSNSTLQPPEYLITANALVWKQALENIKGFNEQIRIAGGEDIDLGFRLRDIGELSFAFESTVLHDFNDGLLGFIKRFRRYGKGNRILAKMYNLDSKPRAFFPNKCNLVNYALAYLQYLSMLWGWYVD